MTGRLEHIHVAAEAGGSMRRLDETDIIAGVGLAGDRYARGEGFWKDDRVSRDLTLVEAEALEVVRRDHGIDLAPGETRRNLTTRGVSLEALIDRYFWIGGVLARGTSRCDPCQHLADLTGKPVLRPLVRKGGLRADCLMGGKIQVGDPIQPTEEQRGVGVLVVRSGNVLLGRRLSPRGHGTWSFPGGKPNDNESAQACAVRELYEETGLIGTKPELIGQTLAGVPDSREVFRTDFIRVQVAPGEPELREPDKTEGWTWYRWQSLPLPLFPPVAAFIASGPNPDAF
jgi:ADP-ribose pyrophosphatase YjhB (NUDIX family)